MPEPVYRPAARVILLDPLGRILLFSVQNVAKRTLWITPGGGVEPGESFEDAAKRELWEETGIAAEPGSCVWTRHHIFEFQGATLDQHERYFVVRLDSAPDVVSDNWTTIEQDFLAEHRWWTSDEIAASDDYFAPRRLAELLPPIVSGNLPAGPIDCGV